MYMVECDDTPDRFLPKLLQSDIRHVIQKKRPGYERSVARARLLDHPEKYSLLRLEDALLERKVRSMEFSFHTQEMKDRALERLSKFTEGHSALTRRKRQIETVAAELALNAIHSSVAAFREQSGEEFRFSEKLPCRLQIAFNETTVMVSCWDPVGSLARAKILRRLNEIWNQPAHIKITRSHLQSGIGCKVIMDNSTDFIAISLTGKETAVACLMPLHGTAAELERVQKGFHLIVCPPQQDSHV